MRHVAMIPCGNYHSIFIEKPLAKDDRVFAKVKTTMSKAGFQPVELASSEDGSELEIKSPKGETAFSFQKEWIEMIKDNE